MMKGSANSAPAACRSSDDRGVQRIAQLTPLAALLAQIDSGIGAVTPCSRAVAEAAGFVLAVDVRASEYPPRGLALRDGIAVEAAAVAGASPYGPIALRGPPIDAGEPLPDGADAVLGFEAVHWRGDRPEAIASVAAGEGVLPAGGDAAPQTPLRHAGERLRAIDCAVLAAAGIATVSIRVPRVRIGGSAPALQPVLEMLARFVAADGGKVLGIGTTVDDALTETDADFKIVVGGTGSGRHDDSVRRLAAHGRVVAHGIAIAPGETAAFGFIGERPVILIPGRLDAAAAVWLLVGRHILARLGLARFADSAIVARPTLVPLKRKITSTIGMTELIPVRCADDMAEPLAAGYLSLTALALSDGWTVVPATSEGFAAATPIAVNPWP